MTRKDYIAIADGIGLALKWNDTYEGTTGICEVINHLVPVLKRDNPRFDEGRFRTHVDDIAQGRKDVTS